jgi:lambda family phage portal protein
MKRSIRVPGQGRVEISENIIDRVIGYFNPVRGQERFHSRARMAVGGAYFGASKTRRAMSAFMPGSGSANADTIPDLQTLRERSRDLVRNEPLAGGAIGTVVTNVVGAGISMHPAIDREMLGLSDDVADKLEADIDREWRLWSESTECDATRIQNFAGLQDLVFRSALENGDVFSLLPMFDRSDFPYQLKVQIIEADRVSNKDNGDDEELKAAGVQLDDNGAPVSYDIANKHPGALGRFRDAEWDTVPAFGAETGRRNILHCYQRIRAGQTRGVPYLAPVIESLKQLGRYTEAEIMAAVISGMFTVFVKTETGDDLDVLGMENYTGAASSDDDLKLGNGAVVSLAENEDVQFANPGRPNTAFDPFVMSVLRQIGARLELPFEFMIKHFTASYSASQAAMLEAWKFFIARRTWLVSCFCQPVYEEFLMEAVVTGRISMPGFLDSHLARKAYTSAVWVGPGRGLIRPDVEMKGIAAKIEMGAVTRTQATAEINGGSWKRNRKQLDREDALMPAPVVDEPGGDDPDAASGSTGSPSGGPAGSPGGDGQPAPAPNVTVNMPAAPAPNVTVNNEMTIPEQEPPEVTVQNDFVVQSAPAPDVTVEAPDVTVEAPVVTVEAPVVTVEAPDVTVNLDMPEEDRDVDFQYDKDGKLKSAKITDG